MTLRPRPTTLAAAALGLLLGACGGSLYDAAGVPKIDAGAQCNPDTQHVCAAAPNVCQSNTDPDHCGTACEVCGAAPANGVRACVQPPGGGAYGCGFTCTAPARACSVQNACLPDDVNACGPSCQVCTAPAGANPTCLPGTGGLNECGYACSPGLFAVGGACVAPTAIAAGANHACAITSGGGLACWGDNTAGQLGVAVAGGHTPREVFASGVTRVAAGTNHTCAIHQGQVKCWGSNLAGQLGVGSTGTGGSSPQVVTLAGATQLAAGASHTCAVVGGGAVSCWGANGSGQLGTGSLVAHTSPFASLVTSGAIQIAAFGDTTCAIASGILKCWGANGSGQTGKGSTSAAEATPVTVPLPAAPQLVSVGGSHVCAIVGALTTPTRPSPLFCWGNGLELQLGTATTDTTPLVPTWADKIDSHGAAAVAATGGGHSCAGRAADIGLVCSGRSDQGQTGVVNSAPQVEGNVVLANVVVASAGLDHTCALVDLGPPANSQVAQCWGSNSHGQLGRTTALAFDAIPALVGP